MINIKKGLDLPISGSPTQQVSDGKQVKEVALVGYDYHGMKPTMLVKEGDRVKLGQPVFEDKKTPGVIFTSPAAGVVKAINRGNRRVFQSLVVELDGDDAEQFDAVDPSQFSSLSREQVESLMVKSGLWTALRTRPFSKVPAVGSAPQHIFVSVMDTNPLAAEPSVVIEQNLEAFNQGLQLLKVLTDGKVYVGKAAGSSLSVDAVAQVEEFSGIHPAGNVGTHIHFVYGATTPERMVWSINYQDVIALAKTFATGQLYVERIVSIAGPQVKEPRLVKTRVGASLDQLLAGELKNGKNRPISGSVFGGHSAYGAFNYLGRYHNQVSVLLEGDDRPILHYVRAGVNYFSLLNINVSKLMGGKKFDFTTTTFGGERAMLPIGQFERVMPLDILATQLLRAVVVGDIETAEKLGVLELDEEDVALCTFACAGKYEYGPILRKMLTTIEAEG